MSSYKPRKGSRALIVLRMLDALSAHGPLIKTHVMMEIYTNSALNNRYILYGMENGLIASEEEPAYGRRYSITPKGEAVRAKLHDLEKDVPGIW
jgi:predicted transcriptional regulator